MNEMQVLVFFGYIVMLTYGVFRGFVPNRHKISIAFQDFCLSNIIYCNFNQNYELNVGF